MCQTIAENLYLRKGFQRLFIEILTKQFLVFKAIIESIKKKEKKKIENENVNRNGN